MKKIKLISLSAVVLALFIFAFKSPLSASVTDEMVTVSGLFTDITRPNITLKAEDGTEYLIHLGPFWYWENNNYALTLNSNAEIYGKLVTGKKEIYAYTITMDGKVIKLVDENGDPLWWKDGKGKNRGNGWGMGYGTDCRRKK